MSVNQGLKSLVESTPNFSNQAVQNLISKINIGWVAKSRTLAQKVNASTVLTLSQKNDLNTTLNGQSYLNLGRLLEDLDNHTAKVLTGELGEARDDNPSSLFVDHVQTVQGFVITIPLVYGYSADSIDKGIKAHFGSVNGILNSFLNTLASAVTDIDSKSLSTDTAYQTATQNISNFLDTLGDSSAFNESTFNSLQTAFTTAANNFNTTLTGGAYTQFRADMITAETTIQDQINLETTNLGTIDTYNTSLNEASAYQTFTENDDIINLMINTSQNASFKSYFENYKTRQAKLSPLYAGIDDSAEAEQITKILRLKGLPDVVDFLDIDAVASKALRDDRLKTKIKDQNKTSTQIIEASCDLLGINRANKDIFALSKTLLDNLNKRDIELIKSDIDENQQIDTLS